VLTTFFSYGEVQPVRQAEIIKNLGRPRGVKSEGIDVEALGKIIAREVNARC